MSTTRIVVLIFIVSAMREGNVIFGSLLKCCDEGYVIGDDFKKCIKSRYNQSVWNEINLSQNKINKTSTCFQDSNSSLFSTENQLSRSLKIVSDCIDLKKNGSLVYLNCSSITSNETASKRCDSVFTHLNMYGATMLIFANIVYLVIYLTVNLTYIMIPGTRRRAYDMAVFSFTSSQAALSITVITLGYSMLCHKQFSKFTYSLFGVTLMIFIVSGVLWLLVISFDVSSTITRFRWAPASGAKGRDETHKFRIYLLWVIAGTIIPVTISAILEFSPLPDDHFAKPCFYNLTQINYGVIVHVTSVPIIAAIASNVLFFYTTAKMIKIQKSTSVASENRKKSLKKKYLMYLQLYLLMDAPYITGALGAIYENLWILKFVRTIQPALLVYAVLPRNIVYDIFLCRKKKRFSINNNKQRNITTIS